MVLPALLVVLASEVQARTWTDKTGAHAVDAAALRVTETTVWLRRLDNGTVITIKMDQLSNQDQDYIASWKNAVLQNGNIMGTFDKVKTLEAKAAYEEISLHCRAITEKAAVKNTLTADESYALGWAHLHLAATAFRQALAQGGLGSEKDKAARQWSENVQPAPQPDLVEGKLVEVSAVAQIEPLTQDPSVATISIPPKLTLEQFPTGTLKLLDRWVKDGHRLWLCNDVTKTFGGQMASGNHSGYYAEVLALVKAAPNSHPLIENTMKVLAHSQDSEVKRTGVPHESLPYMVVPPSGQPLLGSPDKLGLEKVGGHFVAYCYATPLGKGELLYLYPGLDYTKYDGLVFKENLDHHVRRFPQETNGR